MNHIHTFESFLNESYTGAVAVTFKNVEFEPIMSKELYFTIDGKTKVLNFGPQMFMSDANTKDFFDTQKQLEALGFDTGLDVKKRKVLLNGFYEVYDANNKNAQLVQTYNKHSISFIVPESTLKKGIVENSDDRPD